METNFKTQHRRYLIFKIFFALTVLSFFISVFSVFANYQLNDTIPETTLEDLKYENAVYNYFEDENGLFSIEYKNNYDIRNNENIWYLTELKTGNLAFQLFKNTPEISFEEDAYNCEKINEIEICFSKNTPKFVYKNLKFYPQIQNAQKYEFYTRAKALSDLLKTRFPNENFDIYADNCFYDVKTSHPFSGEICFAKSRSIVQGISGFFYPESGVNLLGFLKYLFVIFDMNKYYYSIQNLDMKQFELMTVYNGAFPLIAEAIFQGVIINPTHSDLWPNRVIYKSEANKIRDRFFDYKSGKILKDYNSTDDFNLESKIFIQKKSKCKAKEELDISPATIEEITDSSEITIQTKNGNDLYFYRLVSPGLFEFIFSLQDTDPKDIQNSYFRYKDDNPEKLEGDLLLIFSDSKYRHFKFRLDDESFSDLERFNYTKLEDPNLYPNEVSTTKIFSKKVVDLDIFLEPKDFISLFINRTRNTRYPAWVDISYPDGKSLKVSALIKTRGNAGRGYLKSSYTLEFFKDLKENFNFKGDSFLNGSDELILRSQISDESRIKEKLVYRAFELLGYLSPKSFESTVSINGMELGFYQITEDIKKEFFNQRKIDTDTYIKTKNKSSELLANLKYNLNDQATLDLYDYKTDKDAEKLLGLIKALELNDTDILNEIDTKNIFDYAMFAYIASANDSLTHNYCLYKDEKDKKWRMFFFDADSAFSYAPKISQKKVFEFMSNESENYNNLINFVFKNLSEKKRREYYYDFLRRWNKNLDLISIVDEYSNDYKAFFELDEALWDGRFLEEKDHELDILGEMAKTRKILETINKNIRLEF
jgi:hypothetical protein